jgi:putative ABC transport system substrate-binding protein
MGTPATLALKRATNRIPIVTGGVADPVQSGLIQSLSRPGGNVTGHAALTPELTAKQIEILREIVPPSSRIVMLGNFFGNRALAPILEDLQQAAGRIGLTVDAVDLREPTGIENAMRAMLKNRPAALLLTPDPFVFARHADIAAFALGNRLPSIALWREFASAGGLIAHGPSLSELVQRSTHYVDRILKGAKPGNLPVEQPTKFDLVINLKTAKALGLTIPQSLLLRADQVIE